MHTAGKDRKIHSVLKIIDRVALKCIPIETTKASGQKWDTYLRFHNSSLGNASILTIIWNQMVQEELNM